MKKVNEGYTKIVTDETLRETIRHGSEEYPFQYYYEDIWRFDLHCIDWHWHPEVEFVLVESGRVEFLIGSHRYVLSEGEGIFINAQVIHRFEAGESAVIPNIVFLPTLLSPVESLVYRKYIKPLLISSVDCVTFSAQASGQGEMLETLLSIFALQEEKENSQLQTLQLLLKLWHLLVEYIGATQLHTASQYSTHAQAQLQMMMQFMHKNYPRSITLEDIAQTILISKSGVLNLFQKHLHTSPIRYLVDYRLKQAARLLINTQYSIASGARHTGFTNTGYFCRAFKKMIGVTPGEYRKMPLSR